MSARDVTIRYQPDGTAPGRAGRWVAEGEDGRVRLASESLEDALRGILSTLSAEGAGPVGITVRLDRGLAMDPAVCGGLVRFEETELTLARLLRTLAQEGSLQAVVEHYPILSAEDAAAAVEFAALVLEGIRVPPPGSEAPHGGE